jgi:hypothetical protein
MIRKVTIKKDNILITIKLDRNKSNDPVKVHKTHMDTFVDYLYNNSPGDDLFDEYKKYLFALNRLTMIQVESMRRQVRDIKKKIKAKKLSS